MKTRREARVVPIGERASCRMSCEVGSKPLLLRRPRCAASDATAVGVESDHMPGANVEAVVALAPLTRSRAEVVEVGGGGRIDVVFVVADARGRDRFVLTPARVVTVRKVGSGSVRIDAVTQR